MSVGWVAATVRGRALLRGLLGPSGAREIAAQPTWDDARGHLSTTGYGTRLAADADRDAARRTATEATLWQLRVLAGWLPPGGTPLARLAAAPVEIANLEAHLARLTGLAAAPPIPLGSLGVAWPRAAEATSPAQLRELLTRSVWGDPGGVDGPALALGLKVAWAHRVARAAPLTAPWAAGAVAVLVAREQLAFGRSVNEVTARQVDQLLGRGWREPGSVTELTRHLPDRARWPLTGLEAPTDLWRAEVAVVGRVLGEAQPAATAARYGRDSVTAVLALLLVDLWRTQAAVEAAGRGPTGAEVLDALAS